MCPERFTWTFYLVIVQKSCNLTDQCPRYLGGPSFEGAVLPRSLGFLDDVTLLGLELLQVLAQPVHLVGPEIHSFIENGFLAEVWQRTPGRCPLGWSSKWVSRPPCCSSALTFEVLIHPWKLATCHVCQKSCVWVYNSLFEIIQSDATCQSWLVTTHSLCTDWSSTRQCLNSGGLWIDLPGLPSQ